MSWLGVPQTPRDHEWRWGAIVGALVTAFGLAVCMTLLFFGMRGVMDLGGFVARGGPYEIAHPAPDWIWVIPVSIVAGIFLGFANAAFAIWAGGFTLAIPAWSALFLSLGWNFVEYGVRPPGGGGLVWGWLACGVLFFAMGLAPLLLRLGPRSTISERVRSQMTVRSPYVAGGDDRGDDERAFRLTYLGFVVVAVFAGAAVGVVLFSALAT